MTTLLPLPEAAERLGLGAPQPPADAQTPRSTMHVTPTAGSWLSTVERFFGIITRQAIRRGPFTSVTDRIAAIETVIDGWNERCQPFTWTTTVGERFDPQPGRAAAGFGAQ